MYKILLVDDEILVRDAIRENIDWKSLDCELVGDCENGRQAVEFVQSHKVDVVLTDICMPYMDGMELSEFLHDNYPDILIVIFSGFGEFEYAKKAIRYNVSEYMLKPVTAMELTKVLRNMKEKLDSRKKEQKKMESLSQTSKDYHKNVDVIRSKALETLVNCTRDVQVSLLELKKLGISFDCSSYRVAVFDMDTYSEMYQVDMHKQQESALMSFVLFNISNEIVTRENAGVAYQEGSNRVCIIFTGCRSREFGDKIHSICQEIPHQDHIFDITVFQIQSLKCSQIISDKFLDQLVIMRCCFFQFLQSFTNTHASHLKALRCYQRIFIKQRNLQITTANIQNCCSFLNDLLEAGFNSSYGFISQKMLFRITQNLNPDTGPLIDLLLNDHRIYDFTKSTCGTRTILGYSKFLHHVAEIFQNDTYVIYHLRLQPSS